MDCFRCTSPLFNYGANLSSRSTTSDEAAQKAEKQAAEIVRILRFAEKPGTELQFQINEVVEANNWTEYLARLTLEGIENIIEAYEDSSMSLAMREAIDKAKEIALEIFEFTEKHPVLVTLIAIGVLALLAPWAVEALGFSELGPVEGTFAAWWQSLYRGFVPKGSLFSFFQKIGMTWGKA